MKYTQNEIIQIQTLIAGLKIPMKIEELDTKVVLRYKHNRNIFASLTKIMQFEFTARNSAAQFSSVSEKEFNQFLYHLKQWLNGIKRDNPIMLNHEAEIEKFSPGFYKVFEEAKIIEVLNYTDSAGMIYRKSLEILFKDFWKHNLSEFEEIILNETIGGIVYFFYDVEIKSMKPSLSKKWKGKKYDLSKIENQLLELQPLISFVSSTFKIGNDFSHYERKLSHYNSADMEKNINLVIEYLSNQYKIIETQQKLKLQAENFTNFKL